ncbi:MAG: serine/threonine-protein kinase [Planctomycetota bacterium]
MAPADPLVGRTFGNVQILAPLGQGGMATVYHGIHRSFGTRVAVKLLPRRLDDRAEQFARRFLREGQTAARIQHANVVQVMDSGCCDGTAYLVMEYVDGSSLGDLLDKKGRLEQSMVLPLAAAIAQGLRAIHDNGVVHRDIKPDNILLTRDGRAKIADLGLARQLDDPELNRLTATGMVVGTPLYVSPEAIRDTKNAGAPSDIYSFGATLYHMLSGKPPFNGKTPFDVMRAHLETPPQPLREIDPGISKHLANLVELCLAKTPERRPSLDQIDAILDNRGRIRQHSGRTVLAMAAVAMVLVVGSALLGWQLLARAAPPPSAIGAQSGGMVQLVSTHPLAAAFNDGDWQPIEDQRLRLPRPEVHLRLRTRGLGPLRTWSGAVTSAPGTVRELAPVLEPVAAQARLELPGAGVLYVNGNAHGPDNPAFFNRAGRYALTRWDGRRAHYALIEVRTDGIDPPSWSSDSSPRHPGYLTATVDGRPAPDHHICCWQEVDRVIREDPSVDPPLGWGTEQPYAEAQDLTVQVVRAVQEAYRPLGLRLPDPSEKRQLQALYRTGLWYARSERIHRPDGVAAGNGLLIVVPDAG